MPELLPEGPGNVCIGGSRITRERVSGPPSKMYPVLRDLINASYKAAIKIEIDSPGKRYLGLVTHSEAQDRIYFRLYGSGNPPGLNRTQSSCSFDKIIAFRVRSVEVPDDVELPIRL